MRAPRISDHRRAGRRSCLPYHRHPRRTRSEADASGRLTSASPTYRGKRGNPVVVDKSLFARRRDRSSRGRRHRDRHRHERGLRQLGASVTARYSSRSYMSHETFELIDRLRQAGRSAAMATLVRTIGTTPRKEETKMFVGDDGNFFGSVTIGGCATRA